MNLSRKITLTLLTCLFVLACATAQSVVNSTATPVPTATETAIPPTATITLVPTLDWTPVACTDDDCMAACMTRIDAILQVSPFKDIENDFYKDNWTNLNLVTYSVTTDSLGEPDVHWAPADYKPYQEDTTAHRRIWDFFTSVIPTDIRSIVTRFIIFTDDRKNYLAWVDQTEDHGSEWKIAFDILDSEYPPYLTETLVHEVGHLITLNAKQVPPGEYYYSGEQNPTVCANYLLRMGCSNETSYINRFFQKFWTVSYREWQLIHTAQNDVEYSVMLDNFYKRHRSEFVSAYAATNPEEDMAESWTEFVLSPRPTGDEIADQKILFFYEYPELVQYRRQIIEGLCSYTR